MQPLNLYFDGGSAADGKSITYGFVLKDHQDSVIVKLGRKLLGKGLTSNQAEYLGLIFGLTYCLAKNNRRIRVFSDSQLVVKQIMKEFKTNEEKLIPLHTVASTLIEAFESFSIEWIPREMNSEADRQTRGHD